MKKVSLFFLILIIALIGWWWYMGSNPVPVQAPVTPTSTVPVPPPQIVTSTPEAKIQLDAFQAGDKLTASSTITGKARGNWYFEASFPVELRDSNGLLLVQTPSYAAADWMTTDWVPFTVTLNFPTPATATGTLTFKKDNPSGEVVNDDSYVVEVQF